MPNGLARLAPESLGALNREPLGARREVRAMVARLRGERTVLHSGINQRNEPRTARVVACSDDVVSLEVNNFDAVSVPQIFLSFSLGGREYFFAANPIAFSSENSLDIEMPAAIYRAERRVMHRE